MAREDALGIITRNPVGNAVTFGFGYMDYKSRVGQGTSRGSAALSAAGTLAFRQMFPTLATGLFVGNLVSSGIPAVNNFQVQKTENWQRRFRPYMGGHFRDSEQAATMRARAAQQIRESHDLSRTVLGNEARFIR